MNKTCLWSSPFATKGNTMHIRRSLLRCNRPVLLIVVVTACSTLGYRHLTAGPEITTASCVAAAECDDVCLLSLNSDGSSCISLTCDEQLAFFTFCQTGVGGTCCNKTGGSTGQSCNNCVGMVCGPVVNGKCKAANCPCSEGGGLDFTTFTFNQLCTGC